MGSEKKKTVGRRILVGLAGWSYPDWAGVVYPKRPRGGETPLQRVASWFDLAEINTSFYQIPAPAMAARWVEQVWGAPDFRFAAKLFRGFTHDRRFSAGEVRAFHEFLRPIEEAGRLEALLLQFPWSFKATEENERFVLRLAEEFRTHRIAVEMRHDSWWTRRFFEAMGEAGISVTNIDQPALDNNIPPDERVTGAIAYVRFHGRNTEHWWMEKEPYYGARYDYLYSAEELAPWVERIKRMADAAKSTLVVMNNHFRGEAAVNGMEVAALLERQKGVIPRELFEKFPERLGRVGLPVEEDGGGQGDLFGTGNGE